MVPKRVTTQLGAGKSYWYKELATPEGYVLDPAAYELKVPAGTFGVQPLQTVANTRIVGISPVSIEKQFAFDAGDVASSLTASFRLVYASLR